MTIDQFAMLAEKIDKFQVSNTQQHLEFMKELTVNTTEIKGVKKELKTLNDKHDVLRSDLNGHVGAAGVWLDMAKPTVGWLIRASAVAVVLGGGAVLGVKLL